MFLHLRPLMKFASSVFCRWKNSKWFWSSSPSLLFLRRELERERKKSLKRNCSLSVPHKKCPWEGAVNKKFKLTWKLKKKLDGVAKRQLGDWIDQSRKKLEKTKPLEKKLRERERLKNERRMYLFIKEDNEIKVLQVCMRVEIQDSLVICQRPGQANNTSFTVRAIDHCGTKYF